MTNILTQGFKNAPTNFRVALAKGPPIKTPSFNSLILVACKTKDASDQNTILTFWQTRVIKSKGKVQISQPTVKCLGFDLPKGQRQT